MAKDKIQKFGEKTTQIIDGSVEDLSNAAKSSQDDIFKFLKDEILKFEIVEGSFVRTQSLHRLMAIERKISKILKEGYSKSVKEFLNVYTTIEERAIAFHKSFNDLEVLVNKLSPIRKYIYEQSLEALSGAGLNTAYVSPAKYLIMQQVTTGASITESQKMLERWSKGELTDGKETFGRETPNLERYSTQMARDTAYQYNGKLQEVIHKDYDLNGIRYVGDVIDSSRPLCRHLVGMGEVSLSEIDNLLNKYPQGTIKGTDKSNFLTYRGGYSCRHIAYPVKLKNKNS